MATDVIEPTNDKFEDPDDDPVKDEPDGDYQEPDSGRQDDTEESG